LSVIWPHWGQQSGCHPQREKGAIKAPIKPCAVLQAIAAAGNAVPPGGWRGAHRQRIE